MAGVCGAVQPKINAVLGERVGSSLLASIVNFFAALAVVVIALALRPRTRRRLRELRSWSIPPWMLSAGLGGALVVIAGAVAVETIGVAVFSVAFFAGQITFGLLVDWLGIAPGGRRPVSAARTQAAAVAIAAVVVSQIGRPVGEFAPGLVVLVSVAGAAAAFQSAFNGRITAATGDALTATSVNVVVGLTALLIAVAVVTVAGHVDTPQWPSEPWLYAGGILGVVVVFSLAFATPPLGVLWGTVAMLAAQLVAAFVVDWVVEHEAPTVGVIAGALLIVVAVVLVGRSSTVGRFSRMS